MDIDYWLVGIVVYLLLAVGTFLPVIIAGTRGVKLHGGGHSFEDSPNFSEEAKKRLIHNYSRMMGTLGFWKREAEKYRRFHYYSLYWTVPSLIIITILAQYVTENVYSKVLLTIISAHSAIVISLHRGLKVERNFKAFRQGESEFYDLYRRLLDRPFTFGATEEEQLSRYFDDVENIRRYVRNAELDNFPSMEEAREQLEHERQKKLI
ncbi:MAG: hypothetical protein M3441_02940 [Chloroflexota bacterium]|nr:hypothetical protein [Chloroflexota bacterium]